MSWRYYKTSTGGDVVRREMDALGVDILGPMVALMKRADHGGAFDREVGRVKKTDIQYLKLSLGHNEFRLLFSREGEGGHILLALAAYTKKNEKLDRGVVKNAKRRLKDHRDRGAKSKGRTGSEHSGRTDGRGQNGKKRPRDR